MELRTCGFFATFVPKNAKGGTFGKFGGSKQSTHLAFSTLRKDTPAGELLGDFRLKVQPLEPQNPSLLRWGPTHPHPKSVKTVPENFPRTLNLLPRPLSKQHSSAADVAFDKFEQNKPAKWDECM